MCLDWASQPGLPLPQGSRGWLGSGEGPVGIDFLAMPHSGLHRARYRHLGYGLGGELLFHELQQGVAKCFGEAQIVNIFLSGDHMVSVATTQLCDSVKTATDSVPMEGHGGVPIKFYSRTLEFHVIFTCHKIYFSFLIFSTTEKGKKNVLGSWVIQKQAVG